MVNGFFLPGVNLPHVHVDVVFGERRGNLVFVLDTGFSGDLKIDELAANELGIFEADQVDFTNANGEIISVGFVRGYAEMEGRKAPIRILIVNGSRLAGMGLFLVFGYRVIVDGKRKIVQLESVI